MTTAPEFITAPNFADLEWLVHGFGVRGSVSPPGVVTVKQIHSNIVLDALHPAASEGDALISDQPGVLVGVRTADCVPILLVDTARRVVAAVHAGWRGTAGKISSETVREMVARWGAQPESIRAAIGPSIGHCCYEVGPEVARRFGIEGSKPVHLDLKQINEVQLREAGISQIWPSQECTFCRPERFYSFRRDREEAGRMLSFIGVQKNIGRTSQGPPGNSTRSMC